MPSMGRSKVPPAVCIQCVLVALAHLLYGKVQFAKRGLTAAQYFQCYSGMLAACACQSSNNPAPTRKPKPRIAQCTIPWKDVINLKLMTLGDVGVGKSTLARGPVLFLRFGFRESWGLTSLVRDPSIRRSGCLEWTSA